MARPGIAPAAFNSGLMQPLFTELANLPQNTRCASEPLGTAEFRNNRHEVSLYVSALLMNLTEFWKRTPLTISVDTFLAFPVNSWASSI